MNHLDLLGGGSLCMLLASLLGLAGTASPSPYIASGIVLISMGVAVKNK